MRTQSVYLFFWQVPRSWDKRISYYRIWARYQCHVDPLSQVEPGIQINTDSIWICQSVQSFLLTLIFLSFPLWIFFVHWSSIGFLLSQILVWLPCSSIFGMLIIKNANLVIAHFCKGEFKNHPHCFSQIIVSLQKRETFDENVHKYDYVNRSSQRTAFNFQPKHIADWF